MLKSGKKELDQRARDALQEIPPTAAMAILVFNEFGSNSRHPWYLEPGTIFAGVTGLGLTASAAIIGCSTAGNEAQHELR